METTSIPSELQAELVKMRRNPEHFHVNGAYTCQFHGGKEKHGLRLIGASSGVEVGVWCPVHGWLHFDSVGYPPTERLLAWEIEERKLGEQRRAAVARRREAQQ